MKSRGRSYTVYHLYCVSNVRIDAHTESEKRNENKRYWITEAILSNEDRKLKFEATSNGYDTQMRREVKKNERKKNTDTQHNITTHSTHRAQRTNNTVQSNANVAATSAPDGLKGKTG